MSFCRMDRRGWIVLLGCLVAAGCGGSGGEEVVEVKGRLTNAGQPLEVQGKEVGLGLVQLQFYRLGPDGKPSTDPEGARLDDQGNFTLPGRDGKGIPPGCYRIAVHQWDPYPQVDRLEGKFDVEKSPITREIDGKSEVIIYVSKPEG